MNELKGQSKSKESTRKNPPVMPSLSDHPPPALNFLSNAGTCTYHNNLSSVTINPQGETAARMLGLSMTATQQMPMLERVQKRVLDKFMDANTTPQTKRVTDKVHKQLTHNGATFTTIVDCFQNIQYSQEITDACIDLQHASG